MYSGTSEYDCFYLQIFWHTNRVSKKYLFQDVTKSSRYESIKTQSQKKLRNVHKLKC